MIRCNGPAVRRSRAVERLFPHIAAFLLIAASWPLGAFSQTWQPVGPAPQNSLSYRASCGTALPTGPTSGRAVAIAVSPNTTGSTSNPVPAMFISAETGGLWRSTNFTEQNPTWTPCTDGLTPLPGMPPFTYSVSSIAIDYSREADKPNRIYAATGPKRSGMAGSGILRSTDGGATWVHFSGPITGTASGCGEVVYRLLVDPIYPNMLYAAVKKWYEQAPQSGLYISYDSGRTWAKNTAMPTSYEPYYVHDFDYTIGSDNTVTLFAGVTFQNSSHKQLNGIWRIANRGGTWDRMSSSSAPSGADITTFALSASHSPGTETICALLQRNNSSGQPSEASFFRSTDRGTNWQATHGLRDMLGLVQDGTMLCLFYAPRETGSEDIYAAGTNSVIRSVDAGATWADVTCGSNGLVPHHDHNALTIWSGQLYDCNDGGVYRFVPLGYPLGEWHSLNTAGLATSQLISIALNRQSQYTAWMVAGSYDNGLTQRTHLTGNFWNQSGAYADGGHVRMDPNNGGRVFGTYQSQMLDRFFQRSLNGGASWSNLTGILAQDTTFRDKLSLPYLAVWGPDIQPPYPLPHVAVGSVRVYESTDGAGSWSQCGDVVYTNPTTGEPTPVTCLQYAPSNSDVLYAGLFDGRLLKRSGSAGAWNWNDAVHAGSKADAPAWGNLSVVGMAVGRADSADLYLVIGGAAAYGGGASPGRIWHVTNAGTPSQVRQDITGSLPPILRTHCIALDDDRGGLPPRVYVGTDDGVYFADKPTGNAAWAWNRFGTGMPRVLVSYLHLVRVWSVKQLGAATYGRSGYIVDVQ